MADGSLDTSRNTTSHKRLKVKYHRPNKNNTKYPINRLPFIDRKAGNCWDMPPSDGYGAGCDMGIAAADAYMKALRESDMYLGGNLQRLVLSLAKAGFDLENDDGRRGQVVGFFSQLDAWLFDTSKAHASPLDRIKESDIERRMTAAASESEAESLARLDSRLRELASESEERDHG